MQYVQEGFTHSWFYSFSKLTILQCLSRSSCSNTCKNPVIHTSEYVESTKIDKIFFRSIGNQTYNIYERDKKKQNEKKKRSHQKYVAFKFLWLLQL